MIARFLAAIGWVCLAWGGGLYCPHHPALTVPWLILLIVYILVLAASLNWLDGKEAVTRWLSGRSKRYMRPA
jgi:phosphatidylglycerophosphate synthase